MDPSKQCVATSNRTGQRCKLARVPGATVCAKHGAAAPQVQRRAQARRAVERAERQIGGLDLAQYADPFDALEYVMARSYAMAERLAAIVDGIPDDRLRYRAKTGEQLRGEVTAAQRALADLGNLATRALKAGVAERRAQLEEHQVRVIEVALLVALESAGLDLEARDRARQALARQLRQASGEAGA